MLKSAGSQTPFSHDPFHPPPLLSHSQPALPCTSHQYPQPPQTTPSTSAHLYPQLRLAPMSSLRVIPVAHTQQSAQLFSTQLPLSFFPKPQRVCKYVETVFVVEILRTGSCSRSSTVSIAGWGGFASVLGRAFALCGRICGTVGFRLDRISER